jgi:hypothetical protein
MVKSTGYAASGETTAAFNLKAALDAINRRYAAGTCTPAIGAARTTIAEALRAT